MAYIELQVETFDTGLVFGIFECSSVTGGMKKVIAEGAELRYDNIFIRDAMGIPEIMNFTITVAPNVAGGVIAGIIANWIYDKLKGKNVERIMIDRKEVQIEKGEITKVISEKIEREINR